MTHSPRPRLSLMKRLPVSEYKANSHRLGAGSSLPRGIFCIVLSELLEDVASPLGQSTAVLSHQDPEPSSQTFIALCCGLSGFL